MIRNQEKPRFIYVLIMSVLGGTAVGIIDIWAFEPSLRYFYGGIASGIALFFSFSVLNYFIPQESVFIQRIVWYFAGGVAGFIWWFLIRPQSLPVWAAIICGILITLIWWFSEGLAKKKSE
jgi:hypothetical protein